MLRGAIDLVQADRIGGWLYSDLGEMSDRTVLAYVDDKCVGSGQIDRMREDLKAAGLGDGRLGFNFSIALDDLSDLPRVIIKLDGSDLALMQPSVTVARAELFQPILVNPERVDWMRQKGMLSPAEVAFLKYVQQLCVFDYSLVAPKGANGARPEIADPRVSAQTMFDLMCLRRVELKELNLHVRHAEEIGLSILAEGGTPLSIIALHGDETGSISVVEGSHTGGVKGESFDGAIDYRFGPDRLIFLDLNARFKLEGVKAARLRLFAAY